MNISKQFMMAMSTAYIEDGVLKKWRYDSDNRNSMLHKINNKLGKNLAIDELRYIRSFENVIIVQNNTIEFINFTGKGEVIR